MNISDSVTPSRKLNRELLAPYASLSLFVLSTGMDRKVQVPDLDLDKILEVGKDRSATRYRAPDAPQLQSDPTAGVWMTWYTERRRPVWRANVGDLQGDDPIVDEVQQLVLVVACDEYLALYASEDAARTKLGSTWMESNSDRNVARVEPAVLHKAFANAPAQRLWLHGLHRPTDRKASSKTLTGSRLRRALHPLDDQTYRYSAARCVPEDGKAIGFSPAKSRIWIGPTQGIDQLIEWVKWVVSRLSTGHTGGRSEDDLLEVLASPVGMPHPLNGPSEVALFPPDSDPTAAELDARAQAQWDRQQTWAERGTFAVSEASPDPADKTDGEVSFPEFRVTARLDGKDVAAFDVAVVESRGRIRLRATEIERLGLRRDADAARQLLQNPDAVIVWFDSGHTLSRGEIFLTRHRDIRFRGWKWAKIKDGNGGIVHKEKPLKEEKRDGKTLKVFAPELVGVGKKSLFCWIALGGQAHVLDTRRGYLLCDDGALEVSDFVHLNEGKEGWNLSLIHVKGANNPNKTRRIAVTDYELVVAQAEKNLRWLDPQNLADQLENREGNKTNQLVWKDGALYAGATGEALRKEIIHRLRNLHRGYQRTIVLLQPSLRKERYERARKAMNDNAKRTDDLLRMWHLDHLLLSLEHGAHAYGADLTVVGHDS